MMRRVAVVLLSVFLFGAGAWAEDPIEATEPTLVESLELDDWSLTSADSFDLYTNAGEVAAKRLSIRILRFLDAVERVTNVGPAEPRQGPAIFVFASRTQLGPFEIPGAAGYMIPDYARNLVALSIDDRRNGIPTLYHELTHDLLNSAGRVGFPTWYDEGFAEFLSTITVREDLATVGMTPASRAAQLQRAETIDFEALLESQSLSEMEDPERFYAESWLLVHYLNTQVDNTSRRLRRFLSRSKSGMSADRALESAFGKTLTELEQALLTFRARISDGKSVAFRLEVPFKDHESETAPVSRRDIAIQLGRLALATQHTETAVALFDDALASDPDDPRAIAGRGRAEIAAGEVDEAEVRLTAALDTQEDVDLRDALGFALISEFLGAKPSTVFETDDIDASLNRARPQFERCLAVEPDRISCLIGVSMAQFGSEGDPELGVDAAERAIALRPLDARLRLFGAQPLVMVGDLEGALARLREAKALAHDRRSTRLIERAINTVLRMKSRQGSS